MSPALRRISARSRAGIVSLAAEVSAVVTSFSAAASACPETARKRVFGRQEGCQRGFVIVLLISRHILAPGIRARHGGRHGGLNDHRDPFLAELELLLHIGAGGGVLVGKEPPADFVIDEDVNPEKR